MQALHPHLELTDQIIRMFGWPALLGAFVWAIRKWDKSQLEFKETSKNAKLAAESIFTVHAQVEKMETNSLVHLQEGITRVATSNDEAVTVLHDIKSGIAILVDRFPRA